jgi:toxin ParE1/3/4
MSRPQRKASRSRDKLPTVYWTERAVSDLDAIGDYISRDDPNAARRWVSKLIATAEKAANAPMGGRRVPEVGRDDVREVFLRNYRIVYRVGEGRIDVLTVFEGHRSFSGEI